MMVFRARHRMGALWCVLLSLTLLACGGTEATSDTGNAATPIAAYGSTVDEWVTTQESGVAPAGAAADTPLLPPLPDEVVEPESGNSAEDSAEDSTTAPANATTTPNEGVTDFAPVAEAEQTPTTYMDEATGNVYQILGWEDLVPPEFQAEAIMARYQEQLAGFHDGDPEAMEIYQQMQEEYSNAPANESLNDTFVRLPGFIAPLDFQDGLVTEFLLVPYFGACIHVPPPPANQTVLVNVAEGKGILADYFYQPIWVQGILTTESATTELATAGYHISEATIQPYYTE